MMIIMKNRRIMMNEENPVTMKMRKRIAVICTLLII